MATGGETELVRRGREGAVRSSFLELFLDLSYIVAFNQLSRRLAGNFTSNWWSVLQGMGETVLLLLALLMIWVYCTLITSRYEPRHPAVQLVIFGTMFASLVMAVSVPEAFGERGLAFAGAYVAILVGRPTVMVIALRGHQRRVIAVKILLWAMASAVPWLAGALFLQGGGRALVWTLALAIDYLGFVLGWPTPRIGGGRIRTWEFTGRYMAERYQQLLIIALGEAILVLGLTSARKFGVDRAAAFVVSLATTVLLWRIYFYRAGTVLAEAIESSSKPARLGRSVPYTHLVMATGVIMTGVGYELVIDHPLGHLNPGWLAAIFGGPVLFLAGRSVLEYEVFARVSRSRIIGLFSLAALALAMVPLPPLAAATSVTLVLTGVAVNDAIRASKAPPEAPSPPR
ncbi:low temperature requirement protein A [Micromonospora sp. KC207]|uniref:low temperature requirement protein A n=1 Tax=Micromonospora sp. KC207 TaxID=2530377 RepID=UPI0010449EE3|nr:low temperature requirement protein A [Micromonospora sp. KC207]TDC44830.1 low temperature requirement protein A [Micromonospora sp. KC207]